MSGGKILGLSLIFVIEPDSNGNMNLTSDSNFSVRKLTV